MKCSNRTVYPPLECDRLKWAYTYMYVQYIRCIKKSPAASQFKGKPKGLAIFLRCCLLSAVTLSWLTLWFEENKIIIDCKVLFFSRCDKSSVYWETGQFSRKQWDGCRNIIHSDACVDFLPHSKSGHWLVLSLFWFHKGAGKLHFQSFFCKTAPKMTPPPTVTWLLVIKQRIVFIECFVPLSVSLQEMLNAWNL